MRGSRGLHIPPGSAIRGGEFTIRIFGFNAMGETDAACDIDDNTIKGLKIRIIGNSARDTNFSVSSLARYFNIASGWDDSGTDANVLTREDEATATVTTLSGANTY